ncbi:unnamed protein product [Linum tenue]|uniref:Uncharacterized protein n=1 Tax=Linum tenue TaxID=586396 RepID=A0AAV0INL7_9ROSI|nr:unnamed protein product [Linum tenue]
MKSKSSQGKRAQASVSSEVAEVVWGYKDPFAAMGLLESCPNLKSFIS